MKTGEQDTASDLRKRFRRGLTWSTLGSGLSQGLTLVASVLLGRWLGQESFGELGIIQANVLLFTVFAGPTLGTTAAKFVAEYRDADPERAGRALFLALRYGMLISAAIVGLFWIGSPWIAENALNAPHLTGALRLSCIALLFAAYDGVQRGALTGFEAFRSIAVVNVVKGVAAIPVLVVLAHYFGLNGAVIGLGVLGALGFVGNYFAIKSACQRHDVSINSDTRAEDRADIASLYYPTLTAALVQLPVAWFLSVLLVRQEGGMNEMGLYNAANNWRMAILFLPTMINTTFIPLLNSTLGLGNMPQFRRLVRSNLLLSAGAALVPAAGIALLAAVIMGAYGPGFSSGTMVLVYLAAAAVLASASGPIGNMLISLRRAWYGTALNAATSIVTIVSFLGLIDRGAEGIALAWLIGYSWHAASSFACAALVLSRHTPTIYNED